MASCARDLPRRGWTVEAAEAIFETGTGEHTRFGPGQVLEVLARLVDRSQGRAQAASIQPPLTSGTAASGSVAVGRYSSTGRSPPEGLAETHLPSSAPTRNELGLARASRTCDLFS
jgi:hypothetical protein